MRKNVIKKFMAGMLSLALVGSMLAGCGSDSSSTKKDSTEKSSTTTANSASGKSSDSDAKSGEKLSGTITMAGSTSMEKFATTLQEYFMDDNPGVTVTTEFIGSGAGIEAVIAGTVDIGNSSRNLKDAEKEAGAVENVVAIDGIAVIVNNSTTVTDLTTEQLASIYKGEITNWSEAGGDDAAIVVVGREAGSGTRGAFEELLKVEDECKYASELNNTGAVVAQIAATKGAIGYVSLDVLDNTVKAVSLNGVEPTAANIKSGDYVLSRPFIMATKGEISEQSELVQALFEYIKSDTGKQIIESVGLLTAD